VTLTLDGSYHPLFNLGRVGVSMDVGYAEYVTLRSEAVVSIPTDLDPAEEASLLCAGVTSKYSSSDQFCKTLL